MFAVIEIDNHKLKPIKTFSTLEAALQAGNAAVIEHHREAGHRLIAKAVQAVLEQGESAEHHISVGGEAITLHVSVNNLMLSESHLEYHETENPFKSYYLYVRELPAVTESQPSV